MTKIVRMVAEIVSERCTGCALCVYVCPTIAIVLRPRRPDEPGPGRRIAELDEVACYNAQNCLEICPEDAIIMHRLPEPFTVGIDTSSVDHDAVKALCAAAGVGAKQLICMCAEVTGGELAAAIMLGAHSPEAVSLSTGARTGCTELCHQPILALLHAAGHGDEPPRPARGFQWYGRAATALDLLGDDGTVGDDMLERYEHYPLASDIRVLQGDFDEWRTEIPPS